MTLRWVKKRDGRRVPFDLRKLSGSIQAAARAAGEEGILADEIGEVVALFLERDFRERIPDTSELADLVERVLLETNHARTAAVYAERRKQRDRTRAEIVVVHEEAPPVAPDGEPLPAPPGEPWNEGKIVAALEHRCQLAPELAEEVASAVESKVFALGFKRVPARLVREIVDGELAERGFSARLGRPGEIVVPADQIRRQLVSAYVRRGAGAEAIPGGSEAAVGIDLLTRFALAEIYPEHVADASREGRIHLHDIGRPLRLTSAALSLESLKVRAGRDGPRSPGELGVAVAAALRTALRFHARAIGLPYANVFLAPLLRGKDAALRRELREFVRLIPPPGPVPAIVRLHVGRVPDALAEAPVVGARGRRWRARYGELRVEAERAARLLIQAVADEGGPAGGAPPVAIDVADAEDLALLGGAGWADAALVGAGLAPQATRGLASGAEIALALATDRALVPAGAAQVVAINCAAAAYRAGRGDDPAFRRELDRALDIALDAIHARWRFLEGALYRPDLPLWPLGTRGGAARDEQPVVPAECAVHALGLVGLDEAYVFLAGETPAQNPAVARLAGEAVAALAARARLEGARRGLHVRLEEPPLEWASRRLAELDIQSTPAAREILGLERAAAEVRYSTGLGGAAALFDVLYRPVGLAPFVDAARARAFLEATRCAPAPPAPVPEAAAAPVAPAS